MMRPMLRIIMLQYVRARGGSGRSGHWLAGKSGQPRLRIRPVARKPQPEGCALTRNAFRLNQTAMLLNNAMADSKAKPGTARTCAETGFKDSRLVIRRYARSSIANFDFDGVGTFGGTR